MQDRDSFCHRARRTRIGDARRAQHDLNDLLPETLVATGGKEPEGLDLDNPEQRRRFMDFAAEREAKIDWQKQLDELESDLAAAIESIEWNAPMMEQPEQSPMLLTECKISGQ